jgi:hypothetical protein
VEQWEEEKGMGTILPAPQNNLIQDSERNEENRYPVLYSNRTKIKDTKNPTMSTRTYSKKKSCR